MSLFDLKDCPKRMTVLVRDEESCRRQLKLNIILEMMWEVMARRLKRGSQELFTCPTLMENDTA